MIRVYVVCAGIALRLYRQRREAAFAYAPTHGTHGTRR